MEANYWHLSVRPSYNESGLASLLPLSNAVILYSLKTRPTFNSDRKLGVTTKYIRGNRTIGIYVFAIHTIDTAEKLCYRYRTFSGFTFLKQNKHSTLTGN